MTYIKIQRRETTTFEDINCGNVFLDDKGRPFIKTCTTQDADGNYFNAVCLENGVLYEFLNGFTIIIPKYEFKIFD